MDKVGKLLMVAGGLLFAVGLAMFFLGDKLRFLGRLPGDIRYETDHVKIYVPLTTMLLLSLLLSVAMWLFNGRR
jgi:Protein of unknown function (DUF2905)